MVIYRGAVASMVLGVAAAGAAVPFSRNQIRRIRTNLPQEELDVMKNVDIQF